ncbi:ATP-dependent protease [Kordiimonas sediminis]|uniref:ATP-dependent protease n=2 Tax=Kordiimonas sediminis TaxID=1735581 RepID=A0A919ALV5_9PROT|nr:ATP-dependent protease [Kordiimonas sediminis]
MPGNRLPLNIFEPRYLAMVGDAAKGNRLIGMIQPKTVEDRDSRPDLHGVGCLGYIEELETTSDGRFLIALKGLCRFQILTELDATTQYRQVQVDYSDFRHDLASENTAPEEESTISADKKRRLLADIQELLISNGVKPDQDVLKDSDDLLLINTLAMRSPFSPLEKQALLEARTTAERGDILLSLIEMLLKSDMVLANDNGPPSPNSGPTVN